MREALPQNDAGLSRREIVKLLAVMAAGGAAAEKTGAASVPLEVDRLWPNCAGKVTERTYRVDATILIFSVPLLRRNGVGDARVTLRENTGDDGRRLALEFAAASDPARAHGLDRMGWIREVVAEKDAVPLRAGVLGIMSDSPEQTAEEARAVLHGDPNGQRLAAIDSSHAPGHTRSRVLHFRAPRGAWTTGESLPDLARRCFDSDPPASHEIDWPAEPDAPPMTFLYALKRGLERKGASRGSYVWNQDQFTLRMERAPDPAQGAQFASSGLVSAADRIDRIHGELENVTKRLHPLRFQLRVDRESAVPVPLRVEFQPRSFLKLSLESLNPPSAVRLTEKP
jgi:hypothetical protein